MCSSRQRILPTTPMKTNSAYYYNVAVLTDVTRKRVINCFRTIKEYEVSY